MASGHSHGDQGNKCHLGNGIKHVVQIGFDNVHFFRDNPNVPSDLQLMPNLLNFFEDNGTFLSNNHTPLIAHTADDLLTTATGLYGDRQGNGISNSYQAYNADGTTDPATSFTYWTDPIDDTARTPNAGHDTNPNMVYSPVPPATAILAGLADHGRRRRRGCPTPGPAATSARSRRPTRSWRTPPSTSRRSSAPTRRRLSRSPPTPTPSRTMRPPTTSASGVHCAKGAAFCADAQAVKFGQTTPSHTAVADLLPDEPGGYSGYQALFGSRYIAPQLGGGTPSLSQDGVPVTNAAGNLTDEFGNEIDGDFTASRPGFPGFGEINAPQSLSYAADMLEHGVQVVNMYISDIHGNQDLPNSPQVPTMGTDCASQPERARQRQPVLHRPGEVLQRRVRRLLQAAGRRRHHAEEHAVRPQLGRGRPRGRRQRRPRVPPIPGRLRRRRPFPAPTPSANFGELSGNATGLLASETGNTTPFSMENDTAPEFYLTGNPGPDGSGGATVRARRGGPDQPAEPYTGTANEKITNYLANPVEEGILHFVDADPARTPTLAMFAKPDYFLQAAPLRRACKGQLICQTTAFAWDHGDYAAEINTNYAALRRARGEAPRPRRPGGQPGPVVGGRRTAARPSRGRQPLPRPVGGRDRHPADHHVPHRAAGRLRARRAGHHPDPDRPEPRAQPARA